jgi:hypothetical protein
MDMSNKSAETHLLELWEEVCGRRSFVTLIADDQPFHLDDRLPVFIAKNLEQENARQLLECWRLRMISAVNNVTNQQMVRTTR